VNYKITAVLNSTTVQIEPFWTKDAFSGSRLRIAGARQASVRDNNIAATARLRQSLAGKTLTLSSLYYVEQGPTLVATVDIEGVDLHSVFEGRFDIPLPRTRMMEFGQYRRIREVQGGLQTQWQNPLSALPLKDKPCLGGFPYPVVVDLEVKSDPLSFEPIFRKVDAVYTPEREYLADNLRTLSEFIAKGEEKVLVIYGSGGIGKSWFVKDWLRKNKPDYDVAFIDVLNYPRELSDFKSRLDQDLSERLAASVDAQPGGLRAALRFEFENRGKGVYPGLDYDDPIVRTWVQDQLKELSNIAHRPELNELRLKSYGYLRKKLLIVIDNLDFFSKTDQDELIEKVIKPRISGTRVFIIVPLRKTTLYFRAKLADALARMPKEMELSLLDMRAMIRRRFVTSEAAASLASVKIPGGAGHTFGEFFDTFYADSPAESLIRDLSQGDVRHYVRLFRRHIFSNRLRRLSNIGNEYHCIVTLMFWRGDRAESETTFILNLFDNHQPEELGNALIRWRVLEFFLGQEKRGCGEKSDFFSYYFRRLGYDAIRVREVLGIFHEAGIIEMHVEGGNEMGSITPTGERYAKLIENLWYCIAIKTGMNFYEDLILRDEEAQAEATNMGFALPEGKEWVSDESFLAFIHCEEELEQRRLLDNPNPIQEFEHSIQTNGPRPIGQLLAEAYYDQQKKWQLRRTGQRG
jgi:hypothetical protein